MINIQLEIQEVELLLKHIEQSAKSLIAKVHSQAAMQIAQQQADSVKNTQENPPVEEAPAE